MPRSRSTRGPATAAMIPAVITGITIVSVSESSQIAATRAAPTPTSSQEEKPRSRSHCGAAKSPLSSTGLERDDFAFARAFLAAEPYSAGHERSGHCHLRRTRHGPVDLDGTRLLTDPVLRPRIGPLVRHGPLPAGTSPPASTRC